MVMTGWQVVREEGIQPDNGEQLVGSVTPVGPARVSLVQTSIAARQLKQSQSYEPLRQLSQITRQSQAKCIKRTKEIKMFFQKVKSGQGVSCGCQLKLPAAKPHK